MTTNVISKEEAMITECPECGSRCLEYLPNCRFRCLECGIEDDDRTEE